MAALGYAILQQGPQEPGEMISRPRGCSPCSRPAILEQDFELLQPRPVRDLLGNGYLPALYIPQGGLGTSLSTQLASSSVNSGSDVMPIRARCHHHHQRVPAGLALITLTRRGWSNPVGLHRRTATGQLSAAAGHLFRQNSRSSMAPVPPMSSSAICWTGRWFEFSFIWMPAITGYDLPPPGGQRQRCGECGADAQHRSRLRSPCSCTTGHAGVHRGDPE